jgi:shikimate dehydrogenase
MTRHVALIGRPLRRRHSQVMHDAAFGANGIDASYELREIEPADLPAFVAEARDPGWFGFQVTAPYKQAIMDLLDEIEPEAAAIGAVNSVERRGDGALVGFNTDAPGFALAVERDLGIGFADATVVVVGAGGAARAVAHAAVSGGASELLVAARRLEQAEALAGGLDGRADAIALADPALAGALARADLVVNATTVGMLAPGSVVDPGALGEGTAVFDLVYVPPETELVRGARARGLRAANGAEMLVAQAEIAFARWTGVEGSAAVMREAVDPLIQAGGPA